MLIEISDHLIQFLILEGFIKKRSLPETNLFKRDFRNFNGRIRGDCPKNELGKYLQFAI